MLNRMIKYFFVLIFMATSVFAEDPIQISDSQIAYIAQITNHIQMKGSRDVNARATYFEVQNFSNTMVIDYQNYQNTIIDFLYRYQMTPQPSDESKRIENRGKQALEDLAHLNGKDLERQYIEYEIELHETTLDMIDRVFLPNVTIPELRNLVNSIRPNVVNRLQWANRIKATYERYP